MAKYIDAEGLIEKLKECENQCLKAFAELGDNKDTAEGYIINARRDGFYMSRLFAENAPAADVQEVKHGKWEWCGDHHVCSECGEFALSDEYTGEEVLSDYCPNCGAKMDGGENDEP